MRIGVDLVQEGDTFLQAAAAVSMTGVRAIDLVQEMDIATATGVDLVQEGNTFLQVEAAVGVTGVRAQAAVRERDTPRAIDLVQEGDTTTMVTGVDLIRQVKDGHQCQVLKNMSEYSFLKMSRMI